MILQHIDVNDIGLQLEGWPLSPFLNTCATIAVFQSDGILFWLMDAWNINVSAGVISLAVSFSRRPGILSGPVALCGFKLVKSFMTPLWWIIIGGISDVELTPISDMLLRSSDVKTDEN